jgi:hypothetical protein
MFFLAHAKTRLRHHVPVRHRGGKLFRAAQQMCLDLSADFS